ncbi:riboflavin synthase domain-like protein [Xylariaceae sp. FL0662B]|nr:riboflavin synthase domain-like protein [Xylariaceae sp. FL0662B]
MATDQDNYVNLEDARLANRRLLVLYGSETGNSQDLAEELERLAERLYFKTWVFEMNDVELNTLLQYPLVIFVISTTGQGEVPKNAVRFWKSLLRKRLPPDCLSLVRFTTFGLGDSSYSKYNWAVRKLHKRLEQLGAIEFFPRGEADERHDDGIDGTFLSWSFSLRTCLLTEYPLPEGLSPIPPDIQLPPKFTIELAPSMDSEDSVMLNRSTLDTGNLENIDVKDGAIQTQHTNQKQTLDSTAALFSHVDTPNPEQLKQTMREERMSIYSNTYPARLSDSTADKIKGGIDILDRANVLRDDPSKYSLVDTDDIEGASPPHDLLPIPNGWLATVRENERVTPTTHWQDVRHLTFDIPKREPSMKEEDKFTYAPGDTVVIYPKNFPKDVQTLIDLMGWQDVADKRFEHHARQPNALFSRPRNCYPLHRTTLRQLLLHNYDINSIPKRAFFTELSFYTDDPMHRDRLREFANPLLSDEFYDYTSRPRRSILEVLQDFPTVKIPYQHVPSMFPVIRGREYSIASGGPLLDDEHHESITRVELLVALVKYKTVLRKTRQGLCSRYLSSLKPGTNIVISHMQSTGPDLSPRNRPILAIAPGTGVAPIRSFIWDRYLLDGCGETVLFFGGRNRNADFYFHAEWEYLGVKVFTAFSRDQKEKIYVQDRIREQASMVCDLIKRRATICLCGSSGKMPEAVRLAIYDAMVSGKLAPDRESAKAFLLKNNCIWEEVW